MIAASLLKIGFAHALELTKETVFNKQISSECANVR